MPGTERLFDFDAYLAEFEAKVLSCEKTEKGFAVILDKTAFFPEGGGQFPDEGTLDDAEVTDVQEDSEGIIRHYTEKPFAEGEIVRGKINSDRRFDFMQQHSGEHIFSGIAHSGFGATNVGFHLGTDVTTVDLDVPLSEDQVRFIETEANLAVYKNLPIVISYPEGEELEKLDYRSKKKLSGRIRIVTVPGYDVCACCGTHVGTTGEIGIIKVTSFQNYKGGTRLFMLCGRRALLDYQNKNRDVLSVTNNLSVKPEEIRAAVGRLEEEITGHKIYESALKKELFALKAEKLGRGEKICVFEKDLAPEELRRFCLTVAENFGIAAVFFGSGKEWKYAVASKSENCSVIAKKLNAAFSGRGGGKPELVQGSLSAAEEEIREFINSL